jgi:hypothetical protein
MSGGKFYRKSGPRAPKTMHDLRIRVGLDPSDTEKASDLYRRAEQFAHGAVVFAANHAARQKAKETK